MKFALIFLLSAVVDMSQQQFLRPRPHGLVWWSPYLHPQPYASNDFHLGQSLYDDVEQEHVSARRFRPSRPIPVYQIEDLNADLSDDGQTNNEVNGQAQFPDSQQRVNVYRGFNEGRFFFSSKTNNPFFKTATFTLTSTVTTVSEIIRCVPVANLAVNPAPVCPGRKRRGMDDSETYQFPITPSETLKLTPTAVPSLELEARQLIADEQKNAHELISSKEVVNEFVPVEAEKPRQKRFFFGGFVASTTIFSYSFIGTAVTNTVLFNPPAACLPAGFVVC
ncbi:uncharacterized protein LOC130689409 [Daphnia carinata]|uniref:uncharacterized protein LOC130689409 n=1 Tax=Daphnia carinata TaxID=120202 RepID=UPI0025808A71|nr:uncharacterized protein LOC130689409 [Daphnia carinata]